MRNLFGRRRAKNDSKNGSESGSVKISGPIGQVQHRIHIDHEKSRDHGYEARFYRRHLDPTLSTRVLQNSIYVKIPAVSDDFVNEMTIEMSRLTKTQSMDALDNYELVENEKQISVCSPTRTQSAGLKRNVSKSWHDNLDAICSTTTPSRANNDDIDDEDDSSSYSRDTSMETTTSSSLPPPFTPDDIREASLNLSHETHRQRPVPKARSIENIADVSTSSSEQDDREQKLKILLKKFGPSFDEFDDHYKLAPIPPERKSKTPSGSSGEECSSSSSIPQKPIRTDLSFQNAPVPKPRQSKRPPSPEFNNDHAVYL